MLDDDAHLAYDTALGDEMVQLAAIERALALGGSYRDELLMTRGRLYGVRWCLKELKAHS